MKAVSILTALVTTMTMIMRWTECLSQRQVGDRARGRQWVHWFAGNCIGKECSTIL